MKLLLVLSIMLVSSLQLAAIAETEPTQLEEPTVEPLASPSGSGSIGPIMVQQNPELVTPDARSNQLDNQAQQINQNMNRPQSANSFLREVLDLPDGMIIRGSSRGGIGIGTEY